MKTRHFILFLLVLFISAGCGVSDETEEDNFNDLDTPPPVSESEPHVRIENQFAEKIAVEIWAGSDLIYIPERHEVKGNNLVKVKILELDGLSSAIFTMSQPKDVLALIGVDFNGRYEFLTQQRLTDFGNGSAIRLNDKGSLASFDDNECSSQFTKAQIQATTAIVSLIEQTANDMSGQWNNVKAISNPLYTLLKFVNAVLAGDSQLVISTLDNWTASAGVYTHQETVNNTQLTLSTKFLWGDGFSDYNPTDVINIELHDPNNYFLNLSTEISGDDIIFHYDQAGLLAPVIGVPVDASAGSYQVNILTWLNRIIDNYNSIQWNMVLDASFNDGTQSMQTIVEFNGRPSFNIEIDPVNNNFKLSQNPLTLKLSSISDVAVNSGSQRNQEILLNDWQLKIFPEQNGAKGTAEFKVKNGSNFSFNGFIAYNSNPDTDAEIFLTCASDGKPIQY